jgi:hypothetical protein
LVAAVVGVVAGVVLEIAAVGSIVTLLSLVANLRQMAHPGQAIHFPELLARGVNLIFPPRPFSEPFECSSLFERVADERLVSLHRRCGICHTRAMFVRVEPAFHNPTSMPPDERAGGPGTLRGIEAGTGGFTGPDNLPEALLFLQQRALGVPEGDFRFVFLFAAKFECGQRPETKGTHRFRCASAPSKRR